MWFHFMIIGLLLLIALIFSSRETSQNKKPYLWLAFMILFFISAFRSIDIGNDTVTYVMMFERFGSSSNIFELDTSIEIGYTMLNKILYLISTNPLILFIITSAFILGAFMNFIYKNSNIVWLSIFLFINLRIYYFTLSGIRQAIAMAIILISYEYIKKTKPIPFVLLILIASSFHYSAIVFLIVYPLAKLKFNYKVILLQAIVGIIIYFSFDTFINLALTLFPKYQVYLSSVYFDGKIRLASVMNFLVILVVLIFGVVNNFGVSRRNTNIALCSNVKTANNKTNDANLLLHIISLGVITSFVAINASLLGRISLYFFMFVVIFIPKVIENIKDKKFAVLIIYMILVFALIYNTTILIYRPEWQNVYPFKFYWN